MEGLIEFLIFGCLFGMIGFFATMLCCMVLVTFLDDILGIDVRDLIKRRMK